MSDSTLLPADNAAPHILIVDDDPEIRDLLGRFLQKHGLQVSVAAEGKEMMLRLEEQPGIALIVLDIMMPGEDGLSLCRRLRGTSPLPVILLTAMGEDTDRIIGLEIGADDYLAKPFNPRELLARIRAVLRRTTAPAGAGSSAASGSNSPEAADAPASGLITFDGWTIDPGRRLVFAPDGGLVELSSGEYDMLWVFVTHPRRVLNRDWLLDQTRGRMAAPFDRSVDIQVMRLRRKIEADPKEPSLIKTVRGGGYMFAAEVRR